MNGARSSVFRLAGVVLGAVLLAVAVLFALNQTDFDAVAGGSVGTVSLLAAAVVANLVLTGLLFWAITCSFDARPAVGPVRMVAVVSLSALLNYVPVVRPGLFGRTVFLKARHGLPVRQSLVILGVVLVLAVVVMTAAVALMLAVSGSGLRCWIGLGLVLLLSGLVGPVAGRILMRPIRLGWLWIPIRTADLLVAAARLWLAFSIVGPPIGYAEAVVIAAAALVVKLVGLTPNGLGLSEWLVAALAGVLTPVGTAEGVAAALIDRSVEVVVVTIAGGASAWRLRR